MPKFAVNFGVTFHESFTCSAQDFWRGNQALTVRRSTLDNVGSVGSPVTAPSRKSAIGAPLLGPGIALDISPIKTKRNRMVSDDFVRGVVQVPGRAGGDVPIWRAGAVRNLVEGVKRKLGQ